MEVSGRLPKRLAAEPGSSPSSLAAVLVKQRLTDMSNEAETDSEQDRAEECIGSGPQEQFKSQWDALPAEILRRILRLIGPEHSACARLTCRWWRDLHDSVLSKLVLPRLTLGPALALFPAIETLDTRNAIGRPWPPLTSHEALVDVRKTMCQLTGFKSLTDLSLGGASVVSYKGNSMGVDCAVLSDLAKGLPNLKRLSLAYCDLVRPCGLNVLAPMVALQELDMEGCDNLRDRGLAVIAQTLPLLRVLNVSFCTKITDVGIQSLMILENLDTLNTSCCALVRGASHSLIKNLTNVNLSGCDSFPSLTRLAPIAPQLKSLDITYCRHVLNNSLPSTLPMLTSLTTLKLADCITVTVVGLPVAGSLRNLTSLDISGCYRLSPSSVRLVATSMPNLSRFKAANCPWVDNYCMEILRDLPLEHINLQSCNKITNDGVTEFVRGRVMGTIQELYLDVPGIRDDAAEALASYARQLRVLHLKHVQSLSSAGLVQIFNSISSSVEDLLLDPCTSLHDEGLVALVTAMPNLRGLSLSCTPKLTNVAPLSALTNLEFLLLKGMPKVANETWMALGPLPNLKILYIDDCPLLKSADNMHKRFPRLKSLSLRFCRLIADPVLEHLVLCPGLSELDISGTQVSDIGIPTIAKMALQSVKLDDCQWMSQHFKPPLARQPLTSNELEQILDWYRQSILADYLT